MRPRLGVTWRISEGREERRGVGWIEKARSKSASHSLLYNIRPRWTSILKVAGVQFSNTLKTVRVLIHSLSLITIPLNEDQYSTS